MEAEWQGLYAPARVAVNKPLTSYNPKVGKAVSTTIHHLFKTVLLIKFGQIHR
jgi:hypothetical protein